MADLSSQYCGWESYVPNLTNRKQPAARQSAVVALSKNATNLNLNLRAGRGHQTPTVVQPRHLFRRAHRCRCWTPGEQLLQSNKYSTIMMMYPQSVQVVAVVTADPRIRGKQQHCLNRCYVYQLPGDLSQRVRRHLH